MATLTTILIVFAFTRKLMLSLGVGAVEVICKVILYYFHERIWLVIPFGKKKHPLSSLPVKGEIKSEDMEQIKTKLKEMGYVGDEE